MSGETATVSTLVTVVGQPNTPTSAGNGGFRRGLPLKSRQKCYDFVKYFSKKVKKIGAHIQIISCKKAQT
jgi:hypothetical protein